MEEQFFTMQAINVFGWEFTGEPPSDEFILRMAKIGVIAQYLSDEDNDYEGAMLVLTQTPISGGMNKEFTYHATHTHGSRTVVWTESRGGGRIIEAWDISQKIAWERGDE